MAFFSKSIGIGLEQNAHFQDVMQKLESNWEVSFWNESFINFFYKKNQTTFYRIIVASNELHNFSLFTSDCRDKYEPLDGL